MVLGKASDAVSVATLVIAAIAGVGVGGIIVALINTRQERERQLRESMLTAADEFIGAAASALSQLRVLHPSAREVKVGLVGLLAQGRASVESSDPVLDSSELQAAELKKADVLLDEAKDRLARVKLLFSPDSGPANDGESFLKAAVMVSGMLKTYYALGQPEFVEAAQQGQAGFRSLGKLGGVLADSFIHPAISAVAGGILGGALETFSDVGKARANARQGAQRSLDEADAAIASFTRHAWEALRKPSWKPPRPLQQPPVEAELEPSVELHPQLSLEQSDEETPDSKD